MDQTKLNSILEKHKKWLANSTDGEEANLSGVCLSGADLRGADLSKANLLGANLSCANLSGADLSWANLCRADLSGADLSGADLFGAYLVGADLSRADLSRANLVKADLLRASLSDATLTGTCLDPANVVPELTDQKILEDGLSIEGDYIIGFRTTVSKHCGNTVYEPREDPYIAPVFSTSRITDCHPGIYFASKEWLEYQYENVSIVKCKALRSEVVHAGDKWRAKRLWVV